MKEITLKKPLERGEGEPVTKIVLRTPNGAGELRGLSLQDIHVSDVATVLTLTQRLSMTPLVPQELDRIGPYDITQLAGAILEMFRD